MYSAANTSQEQYFRSHSVGIKMREEGSRWEIQLQLKIKYGTDLLELHNHVGSLESSTDFF